MFAPDLSSDILKRMASFDQPRPAYRSGLYSAPLRQELTARARAYAARRKLAHSESYSREPVICFAPVENRTHGNFVPEAYRAILANDLWRARLQKPHTTAKSAFPRGDYSWRELDSCVSSDALLMNIFCFPRLLSNAGVRNFLGLSESAIPEFGVKARVPLLNGRFDRTEVDMRLGHLLVEAKLTESDFQQKDFAVLENYRDFEAIFHRDVLPQEGTTCFGYQLIRNVLAAHVSDSAFCVLLDARRPDLLEACYAVIRSVRMADVRVRCQVLTWQELSAALPRRLQLFMDEKYGIARRSWQAPAG